MLSPERKHKKAGRKHNEKKEKKERKKRKETKGQVMTERREMHASVAAWTRYLGTCTQVPAERTRLLAPWDQ
jgi:hypothetical protein